MCQSQKTGAQVGGAAELRCFSFFSKRVVDFQVDRIVSAVKSTRIISWRVNE